MANRTSNPSSAAAESLLRQKLRGATARPGDEIEPTNGEFLPDSPEPESNGVHANGASIEAPAAAFLAANQPRANGFPNLDHIQLSPISRADPTSLDALRAENDELHRLVDEMKLVFAQAAEQEAENTRIIEAQAAQIAALDHTAREKEAQLEVFAGQIHELETHIQQAPPPPPTEDELSKMADELEKERCQLSQDRKTMDAERQQLRDDEEDMMAQMREMEISMAKERAEMARQKTEIQRLHSEIKRELDLLQGSDRALTDRLVQFQRRAQDLQMRGGSAAPPRPPKTPAPKPAATPAPAPKEAPGKKDSGLFNRFFKRK